MRSRIKPNGNISATHERSVICGPIGCAIDFVCRLLHLKIISLKKPLQIGLCNKANGKQPFAFELGIGTPGWDLSFGGVSDKNLSPVDYLKKINREVEAKEIERILNKAPEGAIIGNVLDQWHKSF